MREGDWLTGIEGGKEIIGMTGTDVLMVGRVCSNGADCEKKHSADSPIVTSVIAERGCKTQEESVVERRETRTFHYTSRKRDSLVHRHLGLPTSP